jgi:hypothetical protein
LSGLGNAIAGTSSTPDNWSYKGQTLDGTSSTASTLSIPTNVSVNIGSTTSTAITGGTAPFSIKTPPDKTIANAQVSIDGKNLSVTGVSKGTTTMVVQDSSSSNKTTTPIPTPQINTITISGTTGTAGILNVTINSVITSILVSATDTNITTATNLSKAINANTSLSTIVLATNTTPGTVTVTSQKPGTANVFALTTSNTSTALTANAVLTAPASDGNSPNQTVTVTITVGSNGTIAVSFTNPSKNPKNIPASLTDVTKITISGGLAPYNVQTAPDSTRAFALVTDNILSIVGVAGGNTSMVLQDSAGQSLTLNITVGTETPMSALPQSISVGASATITATLSGGTTPYTIVTPPNASTASALISGNTLTIIGTSTGTTSITIQDAFSPAETITIPITVTKFVVPTQ